VNPGTPPIKFRGHHLICLHFSRGEGYNPEFIEKLGEILKKANKGQESKIYSGPDDICIMCPYLQNKKCEYKKDAESEIREMDRTALELLDLEIGNRIKWQDLREKINDIFHKWSKKYCIDCNWREVCEKVKSEF
jgi:hypothetical protein